MIHRRVRHRVKEYVGITDGTTRLEDLFEDPIDEEEIRVRVSDGTIKIASQRNLIDMGPVDLETAQLSKMQRDLSEVFEDINEDGAFSGARAARRRLSSPSPSRRGSSP